MARKNQRSQKKPRTARQYSTRQSKKPKQLQVTPKSPGNTSRPQWLKDARARLSKPTPPSDFEQKSKAAALQQTMENESEQRKLLYSIPRTTGVSQHFTKQAKILTYGESFEHRVRFPRDPTT